MVATMARTVAVMPPGDETELVAGFSQCMGRCLDCVGVGRTPARACYVKWDRENLKSWDEDAGKVLLRKFRVGQILRTSC